mgnify:CR=1 FL=1
MADTRRKKWMSPEVSAKKFINLQEDPLQGFEVLYIDDFIGKFIECIF